MPRSNIDASLQHRCLAPTSMPRSNIDVSRQHRCLAPTSMSRSNIDVSRQHRCLAPTPTSRANIPLLGHAYCIAGPSTSKGSPPIEQQAIEASIAEEIVILVVLVKGVHGTSMVVGYLEHTPLDASVFMPPPRPAARSFRGLLVWRKAHELTLAVCAFTAGFPRQEAYGLAPAGQARQSPLHEHR
jgi:hypothetical protein